MPVLFTDPREYLEELATERDNVRRGNVLITKRAAPALDGAITRVSVESAARIEGGELLRFRGHVGDLRGHRNDAAVQRHATELVARIDAGVKKLGLEVRAGIFEELDR